MEYLYKPTPLSYKDTEYQKEYPEKMYENYTICCYLVKHFYLIALHSSLFINKYFLCRCQGKVIFNIYRAILTSFRYKENISLLRLHRPSIKYRHVLYALLYIKPIEEVHKTIQKGPVDNKPKCAIF